MNTINEFIYCLVTAVSILMCCLAWLVGTFIVDPLLVLSEWLVDFARYIQDEATKMVNTPL